MSVELHYLVILDSHDKPLLFKSYHGSEDDLNIQLHCYASIDFVEEKLHARKQEFLGKIYTIYNQQGEYSIYAFCTLTKIKILAVFKQLQGEASIAEDDIGTFCHNVYRLYKRQLLQAFSAFASTGRFSNRFYEQLDAYVSKAKFGIVQTK